MDVRKVGVVGCGTMGSGICEVAARAGVVVAFSEQTPEAVEAGQARITASLDRAVTKGRMTTEARDEVLSRISGDVGYAHLADADLVVEAVPEQLEIKKQTFRELDAAIKPEAILATNTSSLSVIDLAVETTRSNRVLGFHFFNPAPVMPLIELIRTVVTDPAVLDTATRFAEAMGKTPVVARDRAGFVANLLLFPYLNQAVEMWQSGYASREDIDAAMQMGAGHPMGPLALMDLIGLDSGAAIMESMYATFSDVRHAPQPIVRRMVSGGYTGRKAGRGFYDYDGSSAPPAVARDEPDLDLVAGWRRIGIVGSGTMAAGIAEVSAVAGFEVVLRARTADKGAAAVASIGASLDKAVAKGRLDAGERDPVAARVTPVTDLAELADCDLVIEAVAEDLAVKTALLAELDAVVKPDALLATTTSSLPVIDCAMATARPERVVGIHFFNPATAMRLVELVPTVRTDDRALQAARAFTARVGKHGVLCGDQAGFIVNALLFPYLNDAVKMLEEGYASVSDIDTAMKLGCGHPMGPFELMDIIGLDVTLEIVRALHAELREPGFEPAPLLQYMVSAGYKGTKTGRGFHVYS